MKKKGAIKLIRLTICLLLSCAYSNVWSQKPADDKKPFTLLVHFVGKDSGFAIPSLGIQTGFVAELDAMTYINKLPSLLVSKGYPVASVDSFWRHSDSFHIALYTGQQFNWVQLSTHNIDKQALDAAGFAQKNFSSKPLNIAQVQSLQERLIRFYENQGYPFAAVFLDSIQIQEGNMKATLQAEKGVLYHVDSIRMYGKVKLDKNFLQKIFEHIQWQYL